MMKGDELLLECNESELLWLARVQGLQILKRGLPHHELVAIVVGDLKVTEQHLAGTNYTRGRLEDWISANFDRVRGHLPGCNGKCRSFMCTEAKHLGCFIPTEPLL
jgi:hypothetical protein